MTEPVLITIFICVVVILTFNHYADKPKKPRKYVYKGDQNNNETKR